MRVYLYEEVSGVALQVERYLQHRELALATDEREISVRRAH